MAQQWYGSSQDRLPDLITHLGWAPSQVSLLVDAAVTAYHHHAAITFSTT